MMISKAAIENELRMTTIEALNLHDNENFTQVNNQSFKAILTDGNGVERLVEVKIIIGKVEEERTAAERLESECAEWQAKKDKAERVKRERAEKAEKDKARRKKQAEEKAKREGA